jgi:hypothetical protein
MAREIPKKTVAKVLRDVDSVIQPLFSVSQAYLNELSLDMSRISMKVRVTKGKNINREKRQLKLQTK